jgi:DNA mismatch repair protein MutS
VTDVTQPRAEGKSLTRAGYKLTPVMQQYLDMKRGHEDALLFFRLGDFYEMFFEDAEQAAELLDLTLTTRNRNEENPIPMCGVPYHAAKGYIARLLEAGVKVAICEQIELPARGIARREVTRVVTPGTSLDEDTLAPDRGNFLAAVAPFGDSIGLAWAEFSTGDVRATELVGEESLADELARVAPSEILLPSRESALAEGIRAVLPRALLVGRSLGGEAGISPDAVGSYLAAAANLADASRSALDLLVTYLDATQGGRVAHLRPVQAYDTGSFLVLDRATRRNLELVESADQTRAGSLLAVVDRAVTAMGRRLVRDRILRPLCDAAAIGRRLDAVEWLVDRFDLRADLRAGLRAVGDLERLVGRVGTATATPRDISRLADALQAAAELEAMLKGAAAPPAIAAAAAVIMPLPELCALVRRAIVDEPPAQIGRGSLIRDGYDAEADRLRGIRSDGKGWMMEFEASERRRTGIANLKIGYNKVFGYYIEVSRAGLARVPADYARKQTIANGERYVTEELKRRESDLLGAEERLASLEAHLFSELVATAAKSLREMSATAAALADLDALAAFAETAHVCGYVRPEITRSGPIEIREGRHPVVESIIGQGFVPNDCRLGTGADTVMVITGPNMAGKSTYMRQVAIITLLAHCGCFVPAASARIPLVDRVFTRIGASDRLAQGQSTFMVEMSETAHILRSMTERSLVVLDEIGRGTSTYDGISIAWAVAEAMVQRRVKTLFATHYHELAALAGEHDGVGNYSVGVKRYRGEIVFLYRVEPGASSRSYGIEVAALAGVPATVIERARSLLDHFERSPAAVAEAAARQRGLFDVTAPGAVPSKEDEGTFLDMVRGIEPDGLTPVQALVELDKLVREARKRQ